MLDRVPDDVPDPFGHGIYACLGAPLAKLVARVLLEAFSGTIDSLKLDTDGIEAPVVRCPPRPHGTPWDRKVRLNLCLRTSPTPSYKTIPYLQLVW